MKEKTLQEIEGPRGKFNEALLHFKNLGKAFFENIHTVLHKDIIIALIWLAYFCMAYCDCPNDVIRTRKNA